MSDCPIQAVVEQIIERGAAPWRAEAVRLSLQVESLEHEVETLREKLRRIKGYVTSAWREDVGDQE
jgi:hypothetical protein